MKNLIRAAALAVLAGVSGLGRPALAQPEKPAEKTPSSPVADTGQVIKLVEAGSEPRRQLRYTPTVGDVRTMTMTMKMDQKMRMGERDLPRPAMPTMVMTMEIKVEEVKPNGDITYTMNFTKADVEGDSELPQVAGMKQGLQAMVGMTGRAVVGSRGEGKEVSFKLPPGANPMMEGIVEGMRNQARQMSTPFPEQAVGKGAKWEVVSTIKAQGISMEQTSTMLLNEIKDDTLLMSVDMVQKAAHQVVKNPMGQMEINSAEGAGRGSLEASTTSIMPVKSEMLIKSKYDMKIQEQAMKMDMEMDIKMKTEPGKDGGTPAKKGEAAPAGKDK